MPTPPKKVRISAEIPAYQLEEFSRLIAELTAGERPRMQALERDQAAIEAAATRALTTIVATIQEHPTTGQTKRLVRFLAGVYNGQDYPFDLTDLRGLDDELASAYLAYLNYDRLSIAEVHRHLPGGEKALHGWMRRYGLLKDEAS